MKLAFVGLGVMGYPMAGHLARAGHQLRVYNRSAERARRWAEEYGGEVAATPAQAAEGAEVVLSCVGRDEDLLEVSRGPSGIHAGLATDAIHLDHTTVSARVSRELASALQDSGRHFLDAPVSGGQAGAENGVLTVMIGGDADAYERVRTVLDAYARSHRRLGPSGAGQLAKMVNQICVAGVVQGLAEALRFGERAGLDMAAVVDVIRHGAAQSWQMENRYRTMLEREFDFGFAVDWMRKDLGIVLEEAEANGSSLPITRLIDEYYAEVQASGGGRWDTSSLITRL